MQISGLVSVAVSRDLPRGYDEDKPLYISLEPTVEFSPENNILVFILDRLDVEYTIEALEVYPQLYDYLDGFTHYENNTAEYLDTFPSTTSMLTQHYYRDGLTFSEYWDEAWAQYGMIDTLRDNGFKVNLYADMISTYGNLENIKDRIDNIIEADGLKVNKRGFLSTTVRLSLGRLSPYLLKNIWIAIVNPAFSNELYAINADPCVIQPLVVSPQSDFQFFGYLANNEFSADSDKAVFSFVHLVGTHVDDYLPAALYSLEGLNLYFKKMKEIGIYDNSTIILMGDHGARWDAPVTTSLLIKPEGSTGRLIINSETELSHRYFGASILHAAGLEHERLGLSYFDIIDGAAPPARFFYAFNSWWDERGGAEMITLKEVYEINGDANNVENWTATIIK